MTLPLNSLSTHSKRAALPAKTSVSPKKAEQDVALDITDKALVGGAATVAGVAGMARGAYKAGITDIPKQAREGAKVGSKAGRAVGRAYLGTRGDVRGLRERALGDGRRVGA